MDISQVLALDNGDEVSELQGEVTQVYEQNSGKGKKPPHRKWTVQNFMLYDGSDEIKVGAWNMDDLSELEGKNITLKRDMHFKDDGEYQSVEMGKNTKIIEDDEQPSPSRERKSAPREKGKTAPGESSFNVKQDNIHWGTCLKVAGVIFTGTKVDAPIVLMLARDLYSAAPGTPAQDKVRKLTEPKKEPEPEPEPETENDDDENIEL